MRIAERRESYRGADSEDRCAVLARPGGGVLFVVADGVGGRPNGGAAAERAVALVRSLHAEVAAGDGRGWAGLVTHVDSALSGDPDAGETTLLIVEVTARRIAGASAGDSEAWRVPARAEAAPVRLTANQHAKPFVGSGMARAVGFRGGPLAPNETLLAATDGLFKYADADAITDAARPPDLDAAADALVGAARGAESGRLYDDLALIVCRADPDAPPTGGTLFRRAAERLLRRTPG